MAVGYLRVWPSDSPGHADASTAPLRAFAHLRGLALAHVYTEQVGVSSRDRAAFPALIEALRRPHINTVIIPTPEHFSRFDGTAIAVETGADIVIMSAGGVR